MASQSRAVATRQKIIDAAVELFCDRGYGETGLTDITDRAEVTTGAFYYHFSSKEALAMALIEQGWPKALKVMTECLEAPAAGLEKVIAMTFAVTSLLKHDRSVWIANHLNGAFGQLSDEGGRGFRLRATTFIERMADVLRDVDLREGVTPEEVGALVWINLHGCHLLSDALMDSVSDRLLLSWSTMLRAIVPSESLSYFTAYANRTAAQYDTRKAIS